MERPICELRNGKSGQFTTFNPEKREKTVHFAPGDRKTLVDSNKRGIISRMWFTFPGWFWEHWNNKSVVDHTILKRFILRIYWDNSSFPSVECPMGDFFGIGLCEYKHFASKYLGMSSGGFYSYFPMPFDGVRIELENTHETRATDVFMNINYQEYETLPDNFGRFHAMYNSGYNNGSEPTDILKTEGRGHYAGCCLSMQGEEKFYLSFLEAPEYIFIDSDSYDLKNPSIVGTGLEDYFNGGWYFREGEFNAPLHGVPLKDTLNSSISMYRFHEEDAINFEKSLYVSFINPWDPDRLKPFKFSSTAYWYQDKPSQLLYKLPSKEKLVDWYRFRNTDHLSIP